MRLLILGANGQLGTHLVRTLSTTHDVIGATRTGESSARENLQINLGDRESTEECFRIARPDYVINAAAYTKVDLAEKECDEAFLINADAPRILAENAVAANARLIHFSTDYVFDGAKSGAYLPNDATNPLSVYGQSKLKGEQGIQEVGGAYQIFRTAWAYGLVGRNFLTTMIKLAQTRDELGVVADQFGCPTPFWLIAESVRNVVESDWNQSGVHHIVSKGPVSWNGFATQIFDEAESRGLIPRKPVVRPLTTSEFPTPATRPSNSELSVASFENAFGLQLPDWKDALSATFDREMSQYISENA